MSYDIKFRKGEEVCTLPFPTPHGGTYCAIDDFCEAWLNITFNYSGIFARHGLSIVRRDKPERGVHTLEGKTAAECARILATVIPKLGNDTDPDYWEPTEGNAKKALINLLMIAVAVPPGCCLRGGILMTNC